MRIADNMMFDQVRSNVSKNRSEMSELQNQAATQKRVTKPSDDPIAAARVLGNRVDLSGNKQYLKDLDYAKSFLEFSDQSLAELTENLIRAKELAVGQANDASGNEQSRRVTAAEVEQIFNQLVSVGNRKLGDRFIFGGFKTMDAPFSPTGEYRGDDGEMQIHVDKTQFMAMNIPGNRVFFGDGLNNEGFVKPAQKQPMTIEEMAQEKQRLKQNAPAAAPAGPAGTGPVEMRGPASTAPSISDPMGQDGQVGGVNVFESVNGLLISLNVNDKEGIQDSLTALDDAISQVVMARAQVGSRVTALNNLTESLQKAKVESQVAISQNEDADVFQVVSDINKNESTLQATLQTSSKLVQKSLMDFLR